MKSETLAGIAHMVTIRRHKVKRRKTLGTKRMKDTLGMERKEKREIES